MTEPDKDQHAGRPDMPAGYGLSPVGGAKDLIPWERVEDQLRGARNYWIGTTRPDGRPHAMPVWGVWLGGAFYFSTDPRSRKGRNLAVLPEAVMHLESGDDVVILEGPVQVVSAAALVEAADAAYHAKYSYHLAGESAPDGLVYRLRPRRAFAWLESSFPNSATRWEFTQETE